MKYKSILCVRIFKLIFFFSSIAIVLCYVDDVQHSNNSKPSQDPLYDTSEEPNRACAAQDHLSIRIKIENIIQALLRDNPEWDTYDEADYDISKHVQHASEQFTVQLVSTAQEITNKIKTIVKEKALIASIETLRNKQTTMENSFKNVLTEKFQALENCRHKDITDLKNDVAALTASTMKLSESISSSRDDRRRALETVADRLAKLENITSVEQRIIQMSMNITETKVTSTMKSSSVPTGIENAVAVLCDLQPPTAAAVSYAAWREKPPAQDDLDTYITLNTGCLFKALNYDEGFYLAKATYNGDLFEWRVAVRSRDSADLGINWNSIGYSFFIGQEMNTISRLRNWASQETYEHKISGILSPDYYIPLYIRISNGTLSCGNVCESKPWMVVDVTIKKGDEFGMLFKSWATHGAKFLYDCPARAPSAGVQNKKSSEVFTHY